MRVLVTGGTGYVGSHTVAALVEGGHEVRLLIRAVQRVAPAVAPLGLQAADLDTVVGDVTDPEAVQRAVQGCQAVVHAGSVYSFDSRDTRRIRRVNVRGTDLVLGGGAPCRARPDRVRLQRRGVAALQRSDPDPGQPCRPPAGPLPSIQGRRRAGSVRRRDLLGGLLHEYHRAA
jgi:dihydroflavonol-4-reductase